MNVADLSIRGTCVCSVLVNTLFDVDNIVCCTISEVPLYRNKPFHPMGKITVDPNGVFKLLNNLKIHKASGQDGLSARVLKKYSSEIAPILACICNESLAQGTVPDDWQQANVALVAYNSKQHKQAPSL